jgi:ABC-type transporter Mla subunit MlaD
MPLQDLTPQLRTRLSRLESVVGWFVILAMVLLVTGFVYYVWHTAKRKGWFQEKVLFCTFVNTATGIKAGDQVKMMGFPIGEVTGVVPNAPTFQYGNVTIFFNVRRDANNYCGYIWSDSKVRVAAADFLGNRFLEVTKGQRGIPVLRMAEAAGGAPGNILGRLMDKKELDKFMGLIEKNLVGNTNQLTPPEIEITNVIQQVTTNPWEYSAKGYAESPEEFVGMVLQALNKADPARFYQPFDATHKIYLEPDESPALTERLERVVSQVEKALPSILNLTNQVAQALNSAVKLTGNLDEMVTEARPAVTNAGVLVANLDQTMLEMRPVLTNLIAITTHLREPKGALGEWLIPTNLNVELDKALREANLTLLTANRTLGHADTNVTGLILNLNQSLDNLAGITSNLNRQVQANTNIVSEISSLIRDTDNMVQGLKHHWLLRSAFKTNAPPKVPKSTSGKVVPNLSPRQR